MNSTRQLAARIVERLDDIPNGFRNVDKDALLSDIRDLYDQAKQLETVQYEPVEEPAPKVEEPIAAEPAKSEEPAPIPVVEATPEPVAEVETPAEPEPTPEPAAVETPVAETETNPDEGTLAGKLNQKPIADLRSGIPLNEKFGFIRNLFENNASDYADAIMKLNSVGSNDEALGYVAKLAERKSWDAEDASVKSFRSYVERRHLAVSEANADQ